jgi:uncharacterized protein
MPSARDCLVMAKPAGPRCNLSCDYCYYLDKEAVFTAAHAPARPPWPMSDGLLESYIAQRIESSHGPATHFEWHGGEPTLLGLDYFRLIRRIQARRLPHGRTLTNGLQTNGILIDEAWADFLAHEGFSVGLSIDGPADLHDSHRKGPDGSPSHAKAMHAFGLLKERGVFCNLLCVLHADNAAEPERVYDFFKEAGAKYLQFLPLVLRHGSPSGASGRAGEAASPEAIGDFLCTVFDMWIRCDVGRIVVQAFDEALRPLYGAPHALCVHRETCGDVAVLESDGSFYACDHFVDSDHLIGNLGERSLADLSSDQRMLAFGEAKRGSLPRVCRDCEVLASCNGGCPKDRFAVSAEGEGGLNYLCAAYKRFFLHSKPELTRLAAHMKAGKSLRSFSGP